MRATIHRYLVVALVAAVAFIKVLVLQADIGTVGALVGMACAVGLVALVILGLAASRQAGPGPADHVTLIRAVLTCGVAAVVADAFTNDSGTERSTRLLVVLASVALLLDAVDGPIARHTGTASSFGARFDMECDAFLILVLAVHVSRTTGWWVLLIGAARYLLLLAQRAMPWLGGVVPTKRWRKAVTAYTGAGLTVAASRSLPDGLAVLVVGLGLAALVVSFGTEAGELWRQRRPGTGPEVPTHASVALEAPSTTSTTTATIPGTWIDPPPPASESGVPGDFGLGRHR